MSEEYSFPKNKIKIVLLENIHPRAAEKLKSTGYQVVEIPKSLSENELLEQVHDAHAIGIRSKTQINAEHFKQAKRLLVVGCFGVGTNQVDLKAATSVGVPVFNAPFGNTRSVAELTISFVIMLARKIGDRNSEMHQGLWKKSSSGMWEVRHKVLGVIGFGHIGQQVSVMAEALGMKVIFYDKIRRLSLGNSEQVDSVQELLSRADFVTLHMPALPGNKPFITSKELGMMKKGSFLINCSRGSLIDFEALKVAVDAKQLGGAAIDVYPKEPKTNNEPFQCGLAGVPNIILTPHIGGSTEEAQENIGLEVAAAFTKFIDTGNSLGAVNFPQVDLPPHPESHRVLNIHKNVPGVLTAVNTIISGLGANIDSQYLSTYQDIGYLVMDINKELSHEVKEKIAALDTSIKTRILY